MPRSCPSPRYLLGLVLGLILCTDWLTAQAAAPGPLTNHLPPRSFPQAALQQEGFQASGERWSSVLGAGRKARHAQQATQLAAATSDNLGVEFWLTFPGNLRVAELSLFITGATDTTGTVTIPGLGFTQPFTVMAGTVTTVTVPSMAALDSSDTIENKGIHVTAANEVAVYGLNHITATTDAYLGLPTDLLGTEHIVLTYQNSDIVNGTQFAVVATADATTVTITPSVTTGQYSAGEPYSIALQQGQTYQLRNSDPAPADLTGTIVTSDKPIAMFGSHQCANIPPSFVFCDHLVEQLPPVVAWGKSFVTMPLATRIQGDTFRFLASTDGTNVSVNGTPVATLNRGQFFEEVIATPALINADQPILVAQYSNGTAFDGVTSDPFMMLIPPFEQFLGTYTVTTPATGFDINYVNIVAPNAAVGAIALDGVVVSAESFVPIGSSGFSGAQVPITLGSHNLIGPLPFGTFVYGFADDDSYGYPGGMSVAPVVIVTRLELTPETAIKQIGMEHCLTATVTDQQANPVVGVRVDFNVSGTNPTAGFAATGENGQAQFCYTGIDLGTDSIVASVGNIADTASATWVAPIFQFSDGTNKLTVDGASGEFTLTYVETDSPQLCSNSGARVDEGLLTISSRCQEDRRDVIRAIGPADVGVIVQLIDRIATTGSDRVIRRYQLRPQSAEREGSD